MYHKSFFVGKILFLRKATTKNTFFVPFIKNKTKAFFTHFLSVFLYLRTPRVLSRSALPLPPSHPSTHVPLLFFFPSLSLNSCCRGWNATCRKVTRCARASNIPSSTEFVPHLKAKVFWKFFGCAVNNSSAFCTFLSSSLLAFPPFFSLLILPTNVGSFVLLTSFCLLFVFQFNARLGFLCISRPWKVIYIFFFISFVFISLDFSSPSFFLFLSLDLSLLYSITWNFYFVFLSIIHWLTFLGLNLGFVCFKSIQSFLSIILMSLFLKFLLR